MEQALPPRSSGRLSPRAMEEKIAAFYRRRADELRAAALRFADAGARGMLCSLANRYDRLAIIQEDIESRVTMEK